MYFHLTNIEIILGGFALLLIIIFASAIFFDKYWKTRAPRDFDSDHKGNSFRQNSRRE